MDEDYLGAETGAFVAAALPGAPLGRIRAEGIEHKSTQSNLLTAQALAHNAEDQVPQFHQARTARAVPNDWDGVEISN